MFRETREGKLPCPLSVLCIFVDLCFAFEEFIGQRYFLLVLFCFVLLKKKKKRGECSKLYQAATV